MKLTVLKVDNLIQLLLLQLVLLTPLPVKLVVSLLPLLPKLKLRTPKKNHLPESPVMVKLSLSMLVDSLVSFILPVMLRWPKPLLSLSPLEVLPPKPILAIKK